MDTHTFLWFVLDDPQLSPAMAAIQDTANNAYVSPASHWEIAIKISLGRYRLQEDFETFWSAGMRSGDFRILPVIPGARNDDPSSIWGAWYRARGWWGGRALNQYSYQRPDTGRTVSN